MNLQNCRKQTEKFQGEFWRILRKNGEGYTAPVKKSAREAAKIRKVIIAQNSGRDTEYDLDGLKKIWYIQSVV